MSISRATWLLMAFPFFTTLPLRAQEGSSMTLTMEHSIELAIRNNLTTQLSKAATLEARGRVLEAASGLLPQITASVAQSRVFKTNLAAIGFTEFPIVAFNPVIGPYNSFDARFQLVQTLLDFNVFWVREAAKHSQKIAETQEQLAREQVAAAAALAYLEAQRSERAVAATQADFQLSQSLLKLARDQHSAGVSTGVDVARAETDEAQQNLRLIRAQVDARQSMLRLLRVVGLPLDKSYVLPEIARAALPTLAAPESILAQARGDRPEIHIAEETVQLSRAGLKSARSEYAPKIKATADYGFSGNTPNTNSARTGSIGGRLDLPIFTGGDTKGRIEQASAQEDEARARFRDIQTQVEEDVRLSLETLQAEVQETQTADKAVSLARTELKMARDRFSAGVGDNIQLLSAQTALSRALDDQVDAFARYDTARVNLATALGHTQSFRL